MTDKSSRTTLLEDPQLRPFLPLLWVAWSDGDMEEDDLAALCARVEAMPWLRPAARIALAAWLDPSAPPSAEERAALIDAVERVSATLSPERRRDLVELGASLAEATGADDDVKRALAELEERVGVTRGAPMPVAERAGPDAPAFDVRALQALLDGDQSAVREEVRRFLAQPDVRAYGLPVDEYRIKVAGWLAELAKRGFGARAYPGVTSEEPDLGAFVATFESLAMGDLSLVVRYGVQFGLFGGSVYFLATDAQRREHLPKIATLETPGCFAMSEVGHGSDVANLETVATWQPDTRTFVIHTPGESARKDWIGGAAKHARTATVFAQLEAHGERHGVHAFLVPIRDANGAMCEGVRAGDTGHKMGLNGVDNGRLWFDNVAVPESALLARFARMDDVGRYESEIANPSRRFFTMLGTLVGGRVSVAAAGVTASKVALAIAVRYATARRPFGASDGLPLMSYPTHGRRLLPRLATTYVHSFAIDRLRRVFAEATRATGDVDTRELEAQAAALKVIATAHAVDTARACREACGGQGYLSVNRLPDLCADIEVFTTFEGDNTVLLQLVAKSLLAGFKRRFEGTGFAAVARHLAERAKVAVLEKNVVAARRTAPEHLRDRAFHLAALRYREEQLLSTSAARLRKRLAAKKPMEEAALEVQEHMVALARAHAERLALEWFDDAVATIEDDALRALLDEVGALHGIGALRADAGFYLSEGYFDATKESALRKESDRLIRELVPAARELVDAFGIPDACLAAPIAFMDPAHPTW
ncbi:MAG: acyl-CoA dehydrogenase family protein [Labilithrix sp.]|nr:acyl-CoA dehydrogenase family protein [Labilithrix sp.]